MTRLVLSERGGVKRGSSIGFRRKAFNVATYFEIEDVIDPAETRGLITNGIRSLASVILVPISLGSQTTRRLSSSRGCPRGVRRWANRSGSLACESPAK